MLVVLTMHPVSIRAYGAQQAFQEESMKRINRYTRASRVYGNVNKLAELPVLTFDFILMASAGG